MAWAPRSPVPAFSWALIAERGRSAGGSRTCNRRYLAEDTPGCGAHRCAERVDRLTASGVNMPPHIHALVRVVRRIVSWDGHMAFGANGCGRAGGTGVG